MFARRLRAVKRFRKSTPYCQVVQDEIRQTGQIGGRVKHLKDLSAKRERKLRFDLIPHEAMRGMALGFTIGAEKHAPNGWQTGGDRAHYYGAILRHANAWLAGQEFDADGKHHMDGVMCSAAILRAMCARGIGEDTRSLTPRERRAIAARIKRKAMKD
jgi:hypothetical protein